METFNPELFASCFGVFLVTWFSIWRFAAMCRFFACLFGASFESSDSD